MGTAVKRRSHAAPRVATSSSLKESRFEQPELSRSYLPRHSAILLIACVTAATVAALWWSTPTPLSDLDLMPGARLTDLPQFKDPARTDAMLWGTYRPGFYLGLRTRMPKSLLAGLMWADPDGPNPFMNIRHEAREGDGLSRYGWTHHDGASFGLQELHDGPLHLSTAFVKQPSPLQAPGGDWSLVIEARAEQAGDETPPQRRLALFFYMLEESDECRTDPGSTLRTMPEGGVGVEGGVLMAGRSAALGSWQLRGAAAPRSGLNLSATKHLTAAASHAHNMTRLVQNLIIQPHVQAMRAARERARLPALQLPDNPFAGSVQPGHCLALVQVTADLPFRLDLSFIAGIPADAAREYASPRGASPAAQAHLRPLQGPDLAATLQVRLLAFERRFSDTFSADQLEGRTRRVAQAALSNMLGSVGYFHGSSKIGLPGDQGEVLASYPPLPLYTAVPSRSFFPRGFLWDEGFHLLLIQRWDPAIARDIIAHWLDTLNHAGWMPREQILGPEAASRVPDEFVTQRPSAANPPTLVLPLARMAAELRGGRGGADARQLLAAAWPRLVAWTGWFVATQGGREAGSFRWRGRDPDAVTELNPKTLTSGLDDAPRASHPSQDERHLDLRCWMACLAGAMADIGVSLAVRPKELKAFQDMAAMLSDVSLLNRQHRDEPTGAYYDYGNHTEKTRLKQMVTRDVSSGQPMAVLHRVTSGAPRNRLVPQFGYISLFPFMLQLLPGDSPELGRQLELLADPEHLWTPHGLRSLSKSASLYRARNTEHDAPYWRGPIWINVNFLCLRALHAYAAQEGPHAARAAELYAQLKAGVMRTVVEGYHSQGFLFENYDDVTARGQGSHPFTGWSALITLIATDSY